MRSRCSSSSAAASSGDPSESFAGHTSSSQSDTEKDPSSQRVTEFSDALDLKKSVFTEEDLHRIAQSLKRSTARSKRRRSEPDRPAIHINRAGAKDELRKAFGRD